MRKEATELNNNIEEIGDAISGTLSAIVPLSIEIINIPWIVVRTITEETSGLVDEVIG